MKSILMLWKKINKIAILILSILAINAQAAQMSRNEEAELKRRRHARAIEQRLRITANADHVDEKLEAAAFAAASNKASEEAIDPRNLLSTPNFAQELGQAARSMKRNREIRHNQRTQSRKTIAEECAVCFNHFSDENPNIILYECEGSKPNIIHPLHALCFYTSLKSHSLGQNSHPSCPHCKKIYLPVVRKQIIAELARNNLLDLDDIYHQHIKVVHADAPPLNIIQDPEIIIEPDNELIQQKTGYCRGLCLHLLATTGLGLILSGMFWLVGSFDKT